MNSMLLAVLFTLNGLCLAIRGNKLFFLVSLLNLLFVCLFLRMFAFVVVVFVCLYFNVSKSIQDI